MNPITVRTMSEEERQQYIAKNPIKATKKRTIHPDYTWRGKAGAEASRIARNNKRGE